jgi:ferritin-like metal-binding protein YciE
MALASLKDLYLDELQDLYAAELEMLRTLPRWADAARAPELREALTRHAEESRLHLERLELIFTHWGRRPSSSAQCQAMTGIVQQAEARLAQPATDDARDAAIVGMAQRSAHYEIAAYGCARTYARRLSRPDEARLLQETLDDEGRADRRLTELAEAHINDDARAETDFDEPRPRFRFIDREDLSTSRLADGALHVRNADDDDLGTFDGLVASPSGDPRYIVVDGRTLFVGRRYLLPIREVSFDEAARVLRVGLPRDVAERYPAFDRDAFEAMSGDALRGYDAQLAECFGRSSGVRSRDTDKEGEVAREAQIAMHDDTPAPEWLMTGVWITVPPERARQLSDEVRSFANEFAPNPAAAETRGEGSAERRREWAADTSTRPAPPSESGSNPDQRSPQRSPGGGAEEGTGKRGRPGNPQLPDIDAEPAIEDPSHSTTPPHGDKIRSPHSGE